MRTPRSDEDTFRRALLRKIRQGLYPERVGRVAFLGNRLFRTDVKFPANVPTGTYTVTAYMIRGGKVLSAQSTPLQVSKVGIGAQIFDFAHQQSVLYGLLAIALALFSGWLAGAIFRKV